MSVEPKLTPNRKITNGHRVMCSNEFARYDLVSREVLCNILNEFGIPVELVRLIKMCLIETYRRVLVGKCLKCFLLRIV
jgi:hypothetical protein